MTVIFSHRHRSFSQPSGAFDDLFLNFGNYDLEIEVSDIRSAQSLYAIEVITKIFEGVSTGDFFPDVSQLFE